MWTKLGDAAMGIVERLENGREREAPGQVREETPKEGITLDCGAAPAGRLGRAQVRTKRCGAAGRVNRGIDLPAAPIAASGADRNG